MLHLYSRYADIAMLLTSNTRCNVQEFKLNASVYSSNQDRKTSTMSVAVNKSFTDDDVEKTVTKLLDKAGHDPRVTPRILREKAESRLNLNKGDLKSNREQIKDIIYDWWIKKKSAENDRETTHLKALVRFARVTGNTPQVLKGLTGEDVTAADKIKTLQERLRAKGLQFSDLPTEAETAAAEKAYNLKKDLDGIDSSLIITSTSRTGKRPAETSSTQAKQQKVDTTVSSCVVAVKVEPGVQESSVSVVVKEEGVKVKVEGKPRVKTEYSDEEAEF